MPAPGLETFDACVAQGQVWTLGSPPTAYLIAYPKDTGLLIDTVAVAPDLRGQGTGKALIQFAENLAQKAAHDRIWLYANEVMRENIALYQHLGYEVYDRREEDGYSRVYMEKTLKGHFE